MFYQQTAHRSAPLDGHMLDPPQQILIDTQSDVLFHLSDLHVNTCNTHLRVRSMLENGDSCLTVEERIALGTASPLPSASEFGQYCCAIRSLIITTRSVFALFLATNGRPWRSAIPIVWKWSSLTWRTFASNRTPGSGSRPSRVKLLVPPLPAAS